MFDELSAWLASFSNSSRRISVVIADDPVLQDARELITGLDFEMIDLQDVDAMAKADLGVTSALAGIALTGSIVVDSSIRGSRLASLLPETHLAVVPRERIVDNPGDVLRPLDSRQRLPSNLIFITGPSRSADIEMRLTIGVHGPRRLVLAIT